MQQIFISYAQDQSHGQRLAEQVHNQLQDAGFAVFRDVSGILPGSKWAHEIEQQLKASKLLVLVVSTKALHSDWVFAEFDMAKECAIPVIPVFAENLSAPLWLRHLQRLDFSRQTDWQRLMLAISSHIPLPTTTAPIPPKSQASTKQLDVEWANATGNDEYGRYADLVVKGVVQRFRWIEPGTFLMGSPESEEGRFDDERQHEVTLTQGFWLADTACTQALWLVVMGNNPASFNENPNNPVEMISWNDVQGFIEELNSLGVGLHLRLPTEAEWEYACRAGTGSSFNFGGKDNLNLDKVNYSGKWDELATDGKTKPVKSYPANQWGLYEMHGNVWEWCQDTWREKLPVGSITDPKGVGGDKGQRVVRGGSWFSDGRLCRSAFRFGRTLADRLAFLGCRLSLGH